MLLLDTYMFIYSAYINDILRSGLMLKYFLPVTENRKFRYNILFVLLFCLAVFVPDFVLKFAADLPIKFEWLFAGGIVLFGFLLSLTYTFVCTFFLLLIFLMQLIQLNHMAYFAAPIDAENLMNLVRESKDIFDVSYLRYTWYVSPLLIILYGLTLWIFIKKPLIKLSWVWIVLFYLAAHKPYRAWSHSKDLWYFQPSITRPSLRNSISTFSYFAFRYLPEGYQQVSISYQPYTVREKYSDTENILLVFGESLYAHHLPMYGYERNTAPQMAEILHSDSQWRQALGISGGIATATSTLLFFNTIREPANATEIKAKTANLFRLAKAAGFKTYYISNQESRLTMSFGAKNVDTIITNDMHPLYFKKHQDEGLVELLKQQNISEGKNFIVLHMRSPHSPFENRYKGRKDEFEKFKPAAESKDKFTYYNNTYDNALLYTDMVIAKMIKTFEQASKGRKYSIYVTADHGELFDYNGHWGHNNLLLEQGKVPFFMKRNHSAYLPPVVSHYQIGKLIADDFGFEIINPNEHNNTFYLHGNNIDFPYNFIEYQINSNQIKEIQTGNTATSQQ